MHPDTTLLYSFRSSRFSEVEGENSLPADAFPKKIFRQLENFPTGQNLGNAVAPLPSATTPLLVRFVRGR